MKRIELGDGNWVEVKETQDGTQGDRKELMRIGASSRDVGDDATELAQLEVNLDYEDRLILLAVHDSSYGEVTPAVLDALPIAEWTKLDKAAAEFAKFAFPDFGVDGAGDATSPTGGSETFATI